MMKKIVLLIIVFLTVVLTGFTSVFHLNTIGYLPGEEKIASVSRAFETFQVIDVSNNEVVFTGDNSGNFQQEDVSSEVWFADFTTFQQTGNFHLKINSGEISPVFTIAETVYKQALITSMRAFYFSVNCNDVGRTGYIGHAKLVHSSTCLRHVPAQ